MSQSNSSYRSEYDIDNEYEQAADSAKTSAPPTAAPAPVPKPSIDAFQPRSLPSVPVYIPTLGGRRRDRRNAEDHISALNTATQVAAAAEGLQHGFTRLVEASQQLEMAEQRRTQIPARIEAENLEIGTQLLQKRAAFVAAARQQQDEGVKHVRIQQIQTEDFETTLANRRAARLEAQARTLAAEQSLAHAEETGRRKAEADLHKASEAAFGKEADAEAERRRRDQERQKRGQSAAPDGPDMPAEFAAQYATETRVNRNRSYAERRAHEIRERADRAGRDLSPEEEEEVDALLNAAGAAEVAIRKGDATDLEL